jgi:hypothetical protein
MKEGLKEGNISSVLTSSQLRKVKREYKFRRRIGKEGLI